VSAHSVGQSSQLPADGLSVSRGLGYSRWIGWLALTALAPAALIYLSFNAGGYFPDAPGVVAIALATVLAVRTMLAERPFEGLSRSLAVPLLALALYGALALASISWAHATARVLDNYDRVLLYVLAFLLFGSVRFTRQRVNWLLRALFLGMAAVCLIGLVSRALPHTWPTTATGFFEERLNYPLTYWNAEGMLAALALILGFHLSAERSEHWVMRVTAATLMPAIAGTLLLTFSRGAFGVAALGLIAYCLLTRLNTLVSVLVAVAPTVAISLHNAWDATLLATQNATSPQAVSQGHHLAVVIGECMIAAGALRILMLTADRFIPRIGVVAKPPRLAVRAGVGGLVIAVAVVVALALGTVSFLEKEYDKFVGGTHETKQAQVRERLTDPANDGRLPLWEVALKAYKTQKLRGTGAGTYQQYYSRYRNEESYVTDTHSLYLQSLAELGIAGFLLIAVVVLGILVALASRIRGPDRALYAALLAVVLAWAVHGAFDWDWQMPAVTLPVFMLSGMALARPSGPRGLRGLPANRSLVALGWLLVAICPLLVSVSFTRLQSASAALEQGKCDSAKHQALSSLSFSADRPQAYAIIGVCDLQQGFAKPAEHAMAKAASHEPGSWENQYWLAVALAASGENPHAAISRAIELNPREYLLRQAAKALSSQNPRLWEAASRGLWITALRSAKFSITNL
jgi:O-Antigen ligase